jgi:DNA-binding FrmR family transcriptional regulator
VVTEQGAGPGYLGEGDAILCRLARIAGQVRGVRRMVGEEAMAAVERFTRTR